MHSIAIWKNQIMICFGFFWRKKYTNIRIISILLPQFCSFLLADCAFWYNRDPCISICDICRRFVRVLLASDVLPLIKLNLDQTALCYIFLSLYTFLFQQDLYLLYYIITMCRRKFHDCMLSITVIRCNLIDAIYIT